MSAKSHDLFKRNLDAESKLFNLVNLLNLNFFQSRAHIYLEGREWSEAGPGAGVVGVTPALSSMIWSLIVMDSGGFVS